MNKIFKIKGLGIFILLLTLIFTFSQSQIQQGQTNPTLVYYIDHEDQPQKDYISITLKIQAKDTSLTTAIETGAVNVEQISQMTKQFCVQNSKKKGQCKDIVDAGEFKIEPRYQLIHKQPVFMGNYMQLLYIHLYEQIGFTVTHQMQLSIKSVQKIGYLVDKILTKPGITLQKFQWKAQTVTIYYLLDIVVCSSYSFIIQQPKTHQQAISQGMEEGEGLCKQLGLKLGKVISIQQVKQKQKKQNQKQEEEGKQNGQEQQQNQDDNGALFRFQVQCQEKKVEKSK